MCARTQRPKFVAGHASTENDIAEHQFYVGYTLENADCGGGVMRLERHIAKTFDALKR